MCGINGIVSSIPIKNIKQRIKSMNDAIEHRGKDSSGIYQLKDNISFGHRRLSIIDLNPTGNQPMISNSGNTIIVFNGEVYNYKEIKDQIIDYNFKSETDTEVILAAIEINGIEWFLNRANGMFSIGIYNIQEDRLILVRDRLGIKPLYYYHDENFILFSSEIKGILNSGLIEPQFNENAIDDYLSFRYVREPYTFFEKILQIKSGHYIEFVGIHKVADVKYWDIPNDWNIQETFCKEELRSKFKLEIEKAVKRRMISDVPLGCYLSGGLDSSLLTSIAQSYSEERLNTFSIGFEESNEFEYANIVANDLNTRHHQITVDRNIYFDKWEELIAFKDSPLAVPNEIPLAIMSSKLKESITVVLSGEGADELMGGYGKIFRSHFEYLKKPRDEKFYEYFLKKYEYVPRELRDKYLANKGSYRNIFDLEIKNMFDESTGDQAIFKFFHKYHVKGLLQRVDMSTMQTTVEARVPFLDHELIEFVYKEIPFKLKLRWNTSEAESKAQVLSPRNYSEVLDTPKYLLKDIAYDFLNPKVIERKKVGFPVPLNNWLDRLRELSNEYLHNAPWLKKGCVADLLEQSKKEERVGQILWMFINIEKFRKMYFSTSWKW